MQELIKITQDAQGNRVVSARELHEFLSIKANFTDWCKRMFEYGFTENIDYQAIHNFVKASNGIGGVNKIDYALTIDTAKEIAMIQRNDKGKQAREYFIACEKALLATKKLSPLEILEQQVKLMKEQELRIDKIETHLHFIESKMTTRPSYFTVAGYANLKGISVSLHTSTILGRRATQICKENNLEIDTTNDPRFGRVNMYPENVLQEVFKAI
jgi:phage anti-repressor protein